MRQLGKLNLLLEACRGLVHAGGIPNLAEPGKCVLIRRRRLTTLLDRQPRQGVGPASAVLVFSATTQPRREH